MHINIPGLKDVIIEKIEGIGGRTTLYVTLQRKSHLCHTCGRKTEKIHDYHMRKVKHVKWFERLTVWFYKRRRYACDSGKLSTLYEIVEPSGADSFN